MRGQRKPLQRRTQHKLARVQHKRLILGDLTHAGQIILLLFRINVGVFGIIENPKMPIHAHIHTGGLDQFRVEGVDN